MISRFYIFVSVTDDVPRNHDCLRIPEYVELSESLWHALTLTSLSASNSEHTALPGRPCPLYEAHLYTGSLLRRTQANYRTT